MLRRFIITVTLIAFLCAIGIALAWTRALSPLDQKERDMQWAKVNEAINKGLPQTAIKEIEPIIASALKEKAYPEAIKAIAKKIVYEGMIQGNKPEERITRMRDEIAKTPKSFAGITHVFQNAIPAFRQMEANRPLTATSPTDQPLLFR